MRRVSWFESSRMDSKNKIMEDIVYETQQRIKWYINGIGIHGLTPDLFSKIPTERIVELYNIEISFFKKIS